MSPHSKGAIFLICLPALAISQSSVSSAWWRSIHSRTSFNAVREPKSPTKIFPRKSITANNNTKKPRYFRHSVLHLPDLSYNLRGIHRLAKASAMSLFLQLISGPTMINSDHENHLFTIINGIKKPVIPYPVAPSRESVSFQFLDMLAKVGLLF